MNADSRCVTLYAKKATAIGLLLVSLFFFVGSIWIAQVAWIGYVFATFWAIGIVTGSIQLIPGSAYLKVDSKGLAICNLFRVHVIPWDDVEHFFVIVQKQHGMTMNRFVGFNYAATYDRAKTLRGLAQSLVNCEGMLPNTYGKTSEELADFLNDCHRAFAQRSENEST